MRSLVLLALLVLPAAAEAAPCGGVQGPGTVRVTVDVHNVRDAKGEVAMTVYPDQKRRFLAKGGKLARVRVPAVAGTTSGCFWLIPGSYPFVVYHDANADRDFNRTLFVPKEGYGLSNDAPATMGMPSFERVRVAVGPGQTNVRIRMRYP